MDINTPELTPRVTLEQQTYNLGKAYWIASHVIDNEYALLNTGPLANRHIPTIVPSQQPRKALSLVYSSAIFRGLLDEQATQEITYLMNTIAEDYPDSIGVALQNQWTSGYFAASRHKPLTLACRRRDLGYTVEQMARLLRLKPDDLRRVESGECVPTEHFLAVIAKSYQFSPEEFCRHNLKNVNRFMREQGK